MGLLQRIKRCCCCASDEDDDRRHQRNRSMNSVSMDSSTSTTAGLVVTSPTSCSMADDEELGTPRGLSRQRSISFAPKAEWDDRAMRARSMSTGRGILKRGDADGSTPSSSPRINAAASPTSPPKRIVYLDPKDDEML